MPQFEGLSVSQLQELSPLQLAYIGDAVWDLLVRGTMLCDRGKLRAMHTGATSKVNASSQADIVKQLAPHLTDDEADYVRKGRNARARHSAPKNASCADYAAATGLETLFGYLYVSGQEARLQELYELSLALDEERRS